MPTVDHYLTWLSAMHAEAARLHHREIEPEHMLLGLLAQGGTAAAVLAAQGVTLTRARTAIEEMADMDLARGHQPFRRPQASADRSRRADREGRRGDSPLGRCR